MDQRLPEPAGTDWRGLCEQLVAELERYRPLAEVPDCLDRARTALAQPEPEVVGPDCERNWDSILSPSGGYEMADDAALRDGAQLVNGEWWAPVFGCDSLESALARIRERLERQAAPVPVAVSERLPGAEDCDAEGQCWQWDGPSDAWVLYTKNGMSIRWQQGVVDYWLPAHALPLPSVEVEHG